MLFALFCKYKYTMKQLISILFFVSIHTLNFAQTQKYWVSFTDKCTDDFDPYSYFDEKALQRRINTGLPLYDEYDLPVCENYLKTVRQLSDSITHESRWLNGVGVFLSNEYQLETIKEFSFVKNVMSFGFQETSPLCEEPNSIEKEIPFEEKMQAAQLKILGGEYFEKNNINGKGIRIAVFDAGFPHIDKADAFKHIRDNNKIISTYDFVKDKEHVYGFSHHGTNVLSCIGGIYNNNKVGLATDAEFLLARTENATAEPFSEEENWLAAVEWADKNGAQIINSSLAYTKRRYFYWEMNGKNSLVARAATIAAKKGILVVNAAGNDGDNSWKYIGTPCDADSILTVGGVSPYTNYHISFSSYGPTADKRMKPNICAYGEAAVAGNNDLRIAQGTSFASPLIAGYAACIWQLHPEYNNMQVFDAIQQSGHLYPYYDYAHGYGIPNASVFFEEVEPTLPTISFDETEKNIIVRIKDGEYVQKDNGDYVYLHIENTEGYLDFYQLIKVESQSPAHISKEKLKPGYILRAYYNGYIASYKM